MTRWLPLLVALIGAALLAILGTTPPAPRPATAGPAMFSAARAMGDVRAIAAAPHTTGSTENARVRQYLAQRLTQLGLQVETISSPLSDKGKVRLDAWRGRADAAPPLVSLFATLPGKDRAAAAVLLMAHHDTVWGSPGAADDTAGVAAILEILRSVQAGGERKRDLLVLITDGEELGLEGARAFFGSDLRAKRVGTIINLETRGGGGRAAMFETGRDNGNAMRLFADSVQRPSATSLSVFIYRLLPNSTDLTPALKAGYFGYNFAFIGRPELYHSPLATPDRLDQGALQDLGGQALDLTRALLAATQLPPPAPDRVFFDVFGLFMVSYAPWVGALLLGFHASAYAYYSKPGASLRQVGGGAVAMLALLLMAGLLLWAVNLVSGASETTNYYDRLAAIPMLQVQALLVCLAALSFVHALRPADSALIGFALPMIALALTAQAFAPTAAYPLLVPLALGGLALIVQGLVPRLGLVPAVVAAALGVGYMLALAFFIMQGVGPGMPFVVAIPLGVAAVLAWPLVPVFPRRVGLALGAVLLVGAVGVALVVRTAPLANTVAVYSRAGAPH